MLSAPQRQVDFDHWPYPSLAAHRGGGWLAPENTLAALRMGWARGYRFAEFDVRLSADGVPYLHHDDSLSRTTGVSQPAGRLRYAEIARLDAGRSFGDAFAGEAPPLLAAVAVWMRERGCAANVEIKIDDDATPQSATRVGAVIAQACVTLWSGAPVPPLLSSFSIEALRAARDHAPTLPRGLLCGPTLPEHWPMLLEETGACALHADHQSLTADIVAAVHARRIRVLAYTVNDPGRAALLQAWGVDALITDAIDQIHPTSDFNPLES